MISRLAWQCVPRAGTYSALGDGADHDVRSVTCFRNMCAVQKQVGYEFTGMVCMCVVGGLRVWAGFGVYTCIL